MAITLIKKIMYSYSFAQYRFSVVLAVVMSVLLISCGQDDDVVDDMVLDPDTDDMMSIAPCDFLLSDVDANSTVIINCNMDLNGETITLPVGVKLEAQGGSITNGKINFSSDAVIDGSLLNPSLEISGELPSLKEPLFSFNPDTWGIVQGEVSDEIAFANRDKIQEVIDLVKSLKAETFEINEMDAYFHMEYDWFDAKGYSDRAIHLPSDFHLKMSDQTVLRLQPNNWPRGVFVSVFEVSNVKVSGGRIIGDRYMHDYSPIRDEVGIARDTHEWPGNLIIAGSENVLIENVFMTSATGDALILGAAGHRITPGVKFNKNIRVIGCTMTESRKNNVTVTDGDGLIIENCMITDAGLGENIFDDNNNKIFSSAGVAPKVGFDVEPFRGIEPDGSFVNYEKVDNLLVTGCTFTGNNVSSFINFSGSGVVFENNFSDHTVVASFDADGTKFLNNTLQAAERNRSLNGINFGTFVVNGVQLSNGAEASGNVISGFLRGIRVMGANPIVRNNTISDFVVGIQVDSDNVICENNTMETDRFIAAFGLRVESVNNGFFMGNDITVPRVPVVFKDVNKLAGTSMILDANTFTSEEGFKLVFENADNITLTRNTFMNTEVEQRSTSNFIITDSNIFL